MNKLKNNGNALKGQYSSAQGSALGNGTTLIALPHDASTKMAIPLHGATRKKID